MSFFKWFKREYVNPFLRFLGATVLFLILGLPICGLYYPISLGQRPPEHLLLDPGRCIQIALVVVLVVYSSDRLLSFRSPENSGGVRASCEDFRVVHLILLLFAFHEYFNRELGIGKVAAFTVFGALTLYFSLLLIEQLAKDNRTQILRRRRALHSNRWEWGLTPAAFHFVAALAFGLLLCLSLAMAARAERAPSPSPLAQSSEAALSMGKP